MDPLDSLGITEEQCQEVIKDVVRTGTKPDWKVHLDSLKKNIKKTNMFESACMQLASLIPGNLAAYVLGSASVCVSVSVRLCLSVSVCLCLCVCVSGL